MIRPIPNWQDREHWCYFCHTTVSVKYIVDLSGRNVYSCNRCALKYINEENKEKENENQ